MSGRVSGSMSVRTVTDGGRGLVSRRWQRHDRCKQHLSNPLKNRFEIILHRNQQSIVIDVLLAVVFLFAAMTTGFAMKTALGQLSGVPVASASATPADGLVPCASLVAAEPRGADVLSL